MRCNVRKLCQQWLYNHVAISHPCCCSRRLSAGCSEKCRLVKSKGKRSGHRCLRRCHIGRGGTGDPSAAVRHNLYDEGKNQVSRGYHKEASKPEVGTTPILSYRSADEFESDRLISTTGMGNRSIDTEFAKSKGIPVSGTQSAGNSTIEHIWALILAVARYIAIEDNNVKSKNPQWQTVIPFGLAGRTLGLVGVGRLGAETALVRNNPGRSTLLILTKMHRLQRPSR